MKQSVVGELEQLRSSARERVEAATDHKSLEDLRVGLLGKKGELTAILRQLGSLPTDERAAAGAEANQLKEDIFGWISERQGALEAKRHTTLGDTEWVDMTFVPNPVRRGHLHPLTLILREVKAIFSRLGYEVALGPQVEDEFHNFEALNMPAEHPARDTMDSFYVDADNLLLRTHTSPVQIRYMQSHKPPIRIIAPGAVYRRDATDPSHGSQFYQFEGLAVDHDIRLSDLKGTIEYFARSLFGPDRRIRIVGDHFPFTEPSIGAAVSCGICDGAGCRSCKGGIHPKHYSGFAFGAGLDRLAMLKYNVTDLRLFLENDVRFLRQF